MDGRSLGVAVHGKAGLVRRRLASQVPVGCGSAGEASCGIDWCSKVWIGGAG